MVGQPSRRCPVRLRLSKVGQGGVEGVGGARLSLLDLVDVAKRQRGGVSRCACVEVEAVVVRMDVEGAQAKKAEAGTTGRLCACV